MYDLTPENFQASDEVISKRSYSSKTWKKGGIHVMNAHIGHQHYKDNAGELQESDYHYEDMGLYWRMTKASYRLYIAKDFGAPDLIRFDNKYEGCNHSIYYEPHSLWWVNKNNPNDRQLINNAQSVIGIQSDNKIIYTGAFGIDLDYEITLRRHGFTKELVIHSKTAAGTPPSTNHVPVLLIKYHATGLKIKANDSQNDWDGNSYYESEQGFTVREAVVKYKSYILPAFIEDSTPIDTERKRLKIFWERRNNILWQAKVFPMNFLKNATYPVRADAITNYYADAGGDGVCYESDTGQTWNDAHDGPGSGHDDISTSEIVARTRYKASNSTYFCYRGFYPINTSGLDDGATITAATFNVYGTGTGRSDLDDRGINVIQTTQADPTSLVAGDFDAVTIDGDTEGSDSRIDVDNWNASGWNTFTLNAAGRGWISLTGWTKLGLREGHDLDDVAPDGYSTVDGRYADYANTGSDPYLAVTYTVGAPPYPQIIMIN